MTLNCQGMIDVIAIENKNMYITGWSVFMDNSCFAAPHKYILALNSKLARIFAPNIRREEIAEFYDLPDSNFAFNLNFNLCRYSDEELASLVNNVKVYAVFHENCVELPYARKSGVGSPRQQNLMGQSLYGSDKVQCSGAVTKIAYVNETIAVDGWAAFESPAHNYSPKRFMLQVNGKPVSAFLPTKDSQGTDCTLAGQQCNFSEKFMISGLQESDMNKVMVYVIDCANHYYHLPSLHNQAHSEASCAPAKLECNPEKNLADYKLGIDFVESDIVANGCMFGDDKDVLSVLWSMTDGCNYDCSYCWCSKKFKKFITLEQLKGGADTLFALNRPGYQITLYGGEPTYHPHCLELMEYICEKDMNIKLRMISNGSRKPEYYRKMFKLLNGKQFALALSLHLEHADVDNYCDVVELAASQGINVGVNFMMIPNHFEKAKYAAQKLLKIREKYPFFFDVPYVYDFEGNFANDINEDEAQFRRELLKKFTSFPVQPQGMTPFYTRLESDIQIKKNDKLFKLPRNISRQLINDNCTPSYTNYYCTQGSNVYYITDMGGILGSVCNIGDMMGNIYEDDPEVLIDRIHCKKCTLEGCNSIENIPIPKFNDKNDASRYMEILNKNYKQLLYKDIINKFINEEKSLNKLPVNKKKLESINMVERHGAFLTNMRSLHVEWLVTNMCNYNCTYCSGYEKMDKSNFISREDIDNVLGNIFATRRPRYTFCLLGGEPTVHPHFLYILENIHLKHGNTFSYTVTNCSRSMNFFKDYAKVIEGINHNIMISFHPEYADFKDVTEKIAILVDKGAFVDLHYMLYLGRQNENREVEYFENFERCMEKILSLRRVLPFAFQIVPLINYKTGIVDQRYTQIHYDAIGNYNSEFQKAAVQSGKTISSKFPVNDAVYICNGMNNAKEVYNMNQYPWDIYVKKGLRSFTNFYCCSASNEIAIDDKGNIFGGKCTTLNSPLANLCKNSIDINQLSNIVKCKDVTCICPSNDSLPKFRNMRDAQAFLYAFKEMYKNKC